MIKKTHFSHEIWCFSASYDNGKVKKQRISPFQLTVSNQELFGLWNSSFCSGSLISAAT